MQRFINNANNVVEDMIDGFVESKQYIEYGGSEKKVLKYKYSPKGKVGLVSGGGSGHEPAFIGYIGKNMLDAVAIGEVFSSPTAHAFYEAFKEADQGKGVACLFGNYSGDNMNVKMAKLMAEKEGIRVECVTAHDDIASAPKESKEKRHGIAGGVFMWKVSGAKAAKGASLDEVIEVAKKAVENTRSICVGLSPCSIPDVGHPNFSIKEGTYEFGVGHHGERGLEICQITTAKDIVDKMMNAIDEDFGLNAGEEVSVIISGLGSTPLMELYILYNEVKRYLREKNITVYHPLVGNYVTSLNMNGAAITIMKLDEELKELLDYPAECPAFNYY